ncbi:hypothetical protein CC2G_002738 [Coprinopsis cinerea AmutBmut pab1-1]|nr:hypothetical protein CC2G_002738 [Coprinopsis cinerea AmutBmut pab1-1]
MSTMDPIELARWTRFAMKGGIGKCTALTDCVAESSEDLMFLKDDEIVVLLQVADKEGVYLGYCEGVIGRFSGSHVRFHGKLKKPVMARRASSSTASVSSSREGSTPNTFAKSPTPTFTPPSSRLGGSFGVAGAGSAREGGLGREGVARDGLSRDGTSSRTSTPASPFPNLSNVGAMRSDSRASLGRHHHHMSMSATIQDHTSSSPSSSATPASTSAPPVSAASPPLVDQQQSGRMVGGEVEEEEARPPQFAFSSNTHSPSPSVRNLEQQFHLVEEGWRRGSIRDSSVVSSARVSVDVDADAEEGKARPAPLELLEAHVDPLRITKKSPVVSPAVPAFIEEREGRMPIDEGTALEERSRSSLVDSPNTTVEGSSSSSTTTTATTTTATPSSSNTAPTPSSKNAPLTLSLTNDDSPSEYGDDDDDDDHPLKPPNTSLMPDTSYSTTSFSNRFSVASAEGVVGIGLSLLQDLADGMSDSDSDEDEGEGRGGEDGLGSAGTATYANVGRGGGGVDGVGSGPGSAGLTRNASVRSVDTVDGLRYGDDSEDEDDDDDDEDGPSTSTFFPMPPNTHQDVQLPPGTLSRTHSLAQSARSFGHGHNQSLGGGHGHKQSLGGLGGVGGGGVGVNRSPPQVHTSPPIPSSSPPSTVLQKFPTTDGSSLSPTSPTYPHHAHSHHQHQHQPPNPPYLHYSHQRERRPSEAPSVRSIRSIAHSVRSSGTAATSSSWEGAGDIYDDYRYSRFSMGSVSGFGGSPSGFGGSPSGFSGGGSIGGGGPGSPVPGATFAGAMGAGAGGSLGRAAGKRMSSMSAVTAASEQDVVPPVPVRRGSEGPGVLGVSGGGGGGVGSNAGAGGSNVGVGERGRVLSLDSKAPSVSTTPLGEGEDDESKRSTLRRDSDASVYTQASSSRMSLALSAFKTNPNQHNPHADSFDGRSTAMSGFTAASGFTSTSGFTATSTSGYTTTSNAHGTRPPPLDLQRQRHTSTSTSSSNATSDPENQRSPLLHATWGSPLSSPGMGEHGSPGSGIAMGVAIGSPGAMGYGSPGAGGYGMVSVGNVAIHDGLGSPTSHIGPGAMSGGGMLGVVNPGMAGGTFGRAGGGGIASALRQRVEDERKVGTGGSSLMSLFDGQNQGNAGVKGGYQHSGEEKGEGSMDLSRDGGDDSNDLSTSTNDVDLSRSLDGDTTADLTRSTDFSQSTDLSRSTDGDTSRFTANDTTNDISLTESERRTLGLGRRIVVEDDEELPSVVEDSYTSVGSGESGETEVGGGRDEKQASNTAVKDPSQRQSRQQIILDRARSQREMDRDGEQDMSLVSTTEYSQSSSKDSEDGLAYGTDEDEEDDNVTILPHTPLSAAAPPLPPSLTISSSSRPSTPAEQGSSAASASTTTTATGSTTTTASSTLAPPGQPSHLRPSLRELREGATVRVPGTGERRSLFMPHPGAPKAPKDLGVEESEGPMFLRGGGVACFAGWVPATTSWTSPRSGPATRSSARSSTRSRTTARTTWRLSLSIPAASASYDASLCSPDYPPSVVASSASRSCSHPSTPPAQACVCPLHLSDEGRRFMDGLKVILRRVWGLYLLRGVWTRRRPRRGLCRLVRVFSLVGCSSLVVVVVVSRMVLVEVRMLLVVRMLLEEVRMRLEEVRTRVFELPRRIRRVCHLPRRSSRRL